MFPTRTYLINDGIFHWQILENAEDNIPLALFMWNKTVGFIRESLREVRNKICIECPISTKLMLPF